MKSHLYDDSIVITITDLKEVNNAAKALNLLGKEIVKINFVRNVYLDINTKYYHRFPDKTLDLMYRLIKNNVGGYELHYKNNRLYYVKDNQSIVLPTIAEGLHDLCIDDDKQLTLELIYL